MQEQDFGKHLRALRLAKGLTKEAFCGDEQELSVRQLTRLETGKSQPKLHTLEYLAERLEISVAELLGEVPTVYELPAEYLKLKYQLIRTTSYGDEKVLAELDRAVDSIFELYYEELPITEQEIVEILQSKLYTYETAGQIFGKSILDEKLPQLLKKTSYSINDLLIIDLYQSHLEDEDLLSVSFDVHAFNTMTKTVIHSIGSLERQYLFKARDVLIYVPYAEFIRNDFHYSKVVIQTLYEIMDITQDFQQKPLVKMLEWQYLLGSKGDKITAKECYQDAITLAHLFGNEFLVGKLKQEWEKDLKINK